MIYFLLKLIKWQLRMEKRYGGNNWDFGNKIIASKLDSSLFVIGQTYSYGNSNGGGLVFKINTNGDSLMMSTFGGF